MVSANEAGFYLRETSPLSHNILFSSGVVSGNEVGQRTNLDVSRRRKGYCIMQVEASHLIYLASVRNSAKSGLGSTANRYLNYSIKSDLVNAGGSRQNVKESSLPMSVMSVGGVIVLGGRENLLHGEGRQEFNVLKRKYTDQGESPEYSALAVIKSKSNELTNVEVTL
jgi:hypothetical protein